MDIDYGYFELGDEQVKVLTGCRHHCPLCFNKLSLRSMPGLGESHWHCKECGTEWDVGDLVAAYNNNEMKEE